MIRDDNWKRFLIFYRIHNPVSTFFIKMRKMMWFQNMEQCIDLYTDVVRRDPRPVVGVFILFILRFASARRNRLTWQSDSVGGLTQVIHLEVRRRMEFHQFTGEDKRIDQG